MTRRISGICILVLLCWLCLVPSIGMAAEITDQELARLESNLNQLELNNQEREKRYQKVSDLLVRSDKQIAILSEKLTIAEQSVNQTQKLLLTANASLDKFEKEAKAERNKLRFERNILLIAVGYLALK